MSDTQKSALLSEPQTMPYHTATVLSFERKVDTCLIGKDGLLKEGIKSLLAKTNFQIVKDHGDINTLSAGSPDEKHPQIVIGLHEGAKDVSDITRTLKNRHPESRLVVISSDKTAPGAVAAFSAGLDGYILWDISCDGLVSSLRLVMSGERVCPTSMLASVTVSNARGTASLPDASGRGFSRREMDIIRRLSNGDANKVIASKLDIAEATVKVHVKTILRKFGVSNRTQAAIMAIAQGLAGA